MANPPQAYPAGPDLPSALVDTYDLSVEDDASFEQVRFDGADLSHQSGRGCTFAQVEFRNVSFVATMLADTKFTDVLFRNCDLAAAVWTGISLLRVRFVDCRLSAFALNRASVVDMQMIGCRGECPSIFESDGRRWQIEDSDLAEFDARGLRLTDGRFDQCGLEKSQWGHAKLERVAFVRSDLAGVGGAGGLSRATVDTATLFTLAPALARHVGMTVADDQ